MCMTRHDLAMDLAEHDPTSSSTARVGTRRIQYTAEAPVVHHIHDQAGRRVGEPLSALY